MNRFGRLGRYCLASVLVMAAIPNAARGTPEETGIIAALGLSAADGKTTLGNGAGATEATLLNASALNEAGAIIAGLVNRQVRGEAQTRVLILNHGETVNRLSARTIEDRITRLTARLPAACPPSAPSRGQAAARNRLLFADVLDIDPTLADGGAAVAMTTAYSSVTVTVDERLLLNALAVNSGLLIRADAQASAGPARWMSPAERWERLDADDRALFIIPTETQAASSSPLFVAYQALVNRADNLRSCAEAPGVKDVLPIVDAYVANLNAVSDKAPVSPLALVLQVDAATPSSGDSETESQPPMRILRLAVEHAGGTTATRSSIWFTLGFPGAATVGSGLLVSFRLVDPDSGAPLLTGIVRCAEPQRNIRSVARIVREPDEERDSRAARTMRRERRCTYLASS
jgi:hypothetical protein